jgi:hypothetical protein
VLIDRLQRKTFTGAKTKFFFAPPTPMLINALADLHIEATYQFGDELIRPEPPPSPWQAARAYVDYKEKEVNENPGSPLPRRNASVGSALSAESHKSVRFAEIEAEVRLFNKKDPPSYT